MSASTTPAKPDKRGCPCKHPERLGTAIVSLASFLAIFIAVYLFPVAAPLVKVSPYNNHTNTTHAPSLLVGVSRLCTQRNNHEKWRCSSFSFDFSILPPAVQFSLSPPLLLSISLWASGIFMLLALLIPFTVSIRPPRWCSETIKKSLKDPTRYIFVYIAWFIGLFTWLIAYMVTKMQIACFTHISQDQGLELEANVGHGFRWIWALFVIIFITCMALWMIEKRINKQKTQPRKPPNNVLKKGPKNTAGKTPPGN